MQAGRFAVTSPAAEGSAWFRFLLALYAAIVGVRVFLVEKFGASVARVDEWDATGREVLAAWHNGTFTWHALFQAHNGDHRIVATRLWEILWYVLNGAWDPKLVMIAKAFVYSAAAVIFVHLFTHRLSRRRFESAALFSGLFAFPFGYQNLLWGFQSQFDFFLLAAALGWLALLNGRAIWALVIAAAAPFTLGAGPIIPASYFFFLAAGFWQRSWSGRRCVAFGSAALAVTAFGVLLRDGRHTGSLGSPGEQSATLLKLLGWPTSNLVLLVSDLPHSSRLIPSAAVNFPDPHHSLLLRSADLMRAHPATALGVNLGLSILMLLPLIILAGEIKRQRAIRPEQWGPICLAGFALLLQAATALARSSELLVQTRYFDTVQLVGFASLAAALALAFGRCAHRRVLLLWVVAVAPGYAATMGASIVQLEHGKLSAWVLAVRAYFPDHNPAVLPPNTDWQLPILEHDPTEFRRLLDDPSVDAVLPLSITAPAKDPQPFAHAIESGSRYGLWVALGAALFAFRIARRASVRAGDPVLDPAAVPSPVTS